MFIHRSRLFALTTAPLLFLIASSMGIAVIAPHRADAQEPGKTEAKGGKLRPGSR
jgi:hypothetical protein